MSKEVVVLGGGASGMMAAITATRNGAKVTIMEHKDRLGKKILATGNGKCNLTNLFQNKNCYRSNEIEKAWDILQKFSVADTLDFFKKLGVYPVDRDGYVYPASGQASSVLDVLRLEVERLGIKVVTEKSVKKITDIQADAVIMATGSKAGNLPGADGSGYGLAKKLGLSVIKPLPALVQLKCKENFYKALSGIRVQGKVSLLVDEKVRAEDSGEIQLTAYGISGIPVFQVSRFASIALEEGKKVSASLDFAPQVSFEELLEYLKERRDNNPERKGEDFLLGFFNKKLAGVLIKNANLSLVEPCRGITDAGLEKLAGQIKGFYTEITDTNGFDSAQVCCGGISLEEVNENLESVKYPGLFFAGECLDVDGICGGYNLQWAWSSGYVAGSNAAK